MIPKADLLGIQFEIFDPKSIKKYSVLHVTKPVTYDQNLPTPEGLFDPKLGTIDRYIDCDTCNGSMITCPGHMGHVELARPIYHPGFFQDVLKILRCVCWNCAKILLDKKDITQKDYNIISKHTTEGGKLKICPHCLPDEEDEEEATVQTPKKRTTKTSTRKTSTNKNGTKQHKLIRDGLKIVAEYSRYVKPGEDVDAVLPSPEDELDLDEDDEVNEEDDVEEEAPKTKGKARVKKCKYVITPLRAYNILERISTEDCEWLGLRSYQRPEWFIISILPVPPPSVRPSVQMDTHRRGEDDLTYKLTEIIRANNVLQEKILAQETNDKIMDHWSLLQYHGATYLDNEIPKVARANHRSGRPIKGFKQRLKGKENRIRGNLMGKRVDFSARTVITPDPNLDVDEVGVPMEMAMNLTYEITVTKMNIDRCYELIKNGPLKYTGANYIIKRMDGRKLRVDLTLAKDPVALNLKYGDKIERHLTSEDIVLFNRQPSLHKPSMMGHRVVVLPGRTFRLPVVCVTPYNADFDGKLVAINSRLLQRFSRLRVFVRSRTFTRSPLKENSVNMSKRTTRVVCI